MHKSVPTTFRCGSVCSSVALLTSLRSSVALLTSLRSSVCRTVYWPDADARTGALTGAFSRQARGTDDGIFTAYLVSEP